MNIYHFLYIIKMEANNLGLLIGCFVINLIIAGTNRLASVFYVECMTRYDANRTDASFPFVLCFLMRTLSGPLIGFFGKKYGLKETTIFGCVLSTIGVAACFFAEDILAVKIFWGVLFGLGDGFSMSLQPLMLMHFYENHQTNANGFALAGSCIGGVILPPVLRVLIQNYGTSGSFLLMAGIVSQSIPAAMLLRNIKHPKSAQKIDNDGKDKNPCERNNSFLIKSIVPSIGNAKEAQDNPVLPSIRCNVITDDSGRIKLHQCYDQCDVNDCRTRIIFPSVLDLEKDAHKSQSNNISEKTLNKICEISKDPSKKETLYNKSHISKCKSTLKAFHVLANPAFIVITIVQSIFSFIVVTITTILIDFVRDKSVPFDTEIYFLMSFSLSDLFGDICFGFITDGRYMTRTNYVVFCFFLMGISLLILVPATSFALLLFGVCLFGTMVGAIFVVFPGIIKDFIKTEHQTMAMSSRSVLYAPLSFATSPLIGYVRETLGSYDWIMYILTLACVLCSGLSWLVPCLVKKEQLLESDEEKNMKEVESSEVY